VRVSDGAWRALERSEAFGPVEKETWFYEQRVSVDSLLERFASVSFIAAMADDQRAVLLGEIRRAVAVYDEPIRVPYVTEVYVADRRPG
jgi:hypothetical protein